MVLRPLIGLTLLCGIAACSAPASAPRDDNPFYLAPVRDGQISSSPVVSTIRNPSGRPDSDGALRDVSPDNGVGATFPSTTRPPDNPGTP